MSDAPLLRRIRGMILSGELAPGGRVTEAGLAEQLGVSRTPVRNLLPTLAAEGLLIPVGRRGFAVKAFSAAESWEALELRAFLEGHAARLLALRGASAAVLAELDDCLAEGDRLFDKRHLVLEDEDRYGAMNARFHKTVVEAAEAPLAAGMIARLNMAPFVAPSVIVFEAVGLKTAFDLLFCAHGCHHAIVHAIRSGDGHRAETLFREHAQQQRLSLLARRRKAGADD
jgi:GntR family transcriptional regulator, vanillate catabolism transcriptional regulator